MKKAHIEGSTHTPRKILGFSLPPDIAAEVKVEAARRNISLRKLFNEMWVLYKKRKSV
jgi:hypothetical protein